MSPFSSYADFSYSSFDESPCTSWITDFESGAGSPCRSRKASAKSDRLVKIRKQMVPWDTLFQQSHCESIEDREKKERKAVGALARLRGAANSTFAPTKEEDTRAASTYLHELKMSIANEPDMYNAFVATVGCTHEPPLNVTEITSKIVDLFDGHRLSLSLLTRFQEFLKHDFLTTLLFTRMVYTYLPESDHPRFGAILENLRPDTFQPIFFTLQLAELFTGRPQLMHVFNYPFGEMFGYKMYPCPHNPGHTVIQPRRLSEMRAWKACVEEQAGKDIDDMVDTMTNCQVDVANQGRAKGDDDIEEIALLMGSFRVSTVPVRVASKVRLGYPVRVS